MKPQKINSVTAITRSRPAMSQLIKVSLVAICLCVGGNIAKANTINWNTWNDNTSGTLVSSFTAGGSSQTLVAGYPSYTPSSTFADGVVVNNAPVAANGIMQLTGGNENPNTLTFSTPVVNPVIAIWSLGQPNVLASFVFDQTPMFVAGGPNSEYGGNPISVSGNTVSGYEGNGTVQFLGTYSSISWKNPLFENWYGFNVGAPVRTSVPDGGMTVALLGVALTGIAGLRRKFATA